MIIYCETIKGHTGRKTIFKKTHLRECNTFFSITSYWLYFVLRIMKIKNTLKSRDTFATYSQNVPQNDKAEADNRSHYNHKP